MRRNTEEVVGFGLSTQRAVTPTSAVAAAAAAKCGDDDGDGDDDASKSVGNGTTICSNRTPTMASRADAAMACRCAHV